MNEIKDIISRAINNYSNTAAESTPRRKRFCFPLEADKAMELLQCEYKKAVEARGRIYAADDETARRLHSVANWLTNRDCKPSLLLYGSLQGTGKTTTAAAIEKMARELKAAFNVQAVQDKICREAGGKWIPLKTEEIEWLEICEASVIIPTFYDAGDLAYMVDSNRASFDAAKRCNFLIIDDMGAEPVSVKLYGNEVFPIIEILLYRYRAMLPTIITSNLGLNTISDIYGPRIYGRIKEMCETLYYSQEESYRR